jgi:hypothetical protein
VCIDAIFIHFAISWSCYSYCAYMPDGVILCYRFHLLLLLRTCIMDSIRRWGLCATSCNLSAAIHVACGVPEVQVHDSMQCVIAFGGFGTDPRIQIQTQPDSKSMSKKQQKKNKNKNNNKAHRHRLFGAHRRLNTLAVLHPGTFWQR